MKFVYSAKFALDKCMEVFIDFFDILTKTKNLKTYLDWLSHPNRKVILPKSLELLVRVLFSLWSYRYK